MAETTRREIMLGEGSGTGTGQNLTVGMGPAHPAMHGIIRILAEIDGEIIRKADVEIGYLHRAFEKDCEVGGWNNAIPYTDRLNYVSPLINNFAYANAVEKLLGIEVTERCKYIRTIMSEISRVCDHLTCIGASAMELGAFTVFLYMIKAREFLWELVEDVTGARLTISYGRVGGVKADLPEGFDGKVRAAFKETREVLSEVHRLLTGNRIFMDRMVGVGALSREETIAYAITGPLLRAVGVGYDVRRASPHRRSTPFPAAPSTSISRAGRLIPPRTSTRESRARPRGCCCYPSRCRPTCSVRIGARWSGWPRRTSA
jgi:NADH-quinone oxidoreductase subunit D